MPRAEGRRALETVRSARLALTLGLVAAAVLAVAPPAHEGLAASATRPGALVAKVGGRPVPAVAAELDALVPHLLAQRGIPGASVAVVGGGQLLWAKGYGVADLATGQVVGEETVFAAASFSKTVTAYLALDLVEEGILELDRPLTDYTPGETYIADRRLGEVTLRMVLTHTSGFTDMTSGRGGIVLSPGRTWSYSSDAFRYLQWVIERVTGRPFAEYADERLFTPLGLEHTSFVWRKEFEGLAARGYEAGAAVAPRRPVRANGAFGLLTTPSDFARFVAAILDPAADGTEGAVTSVAGASATGASATRPASPPPARLTRTTLERMLTPGPRAAEDVYWGLGWGIECLGPRGEVYPGSVRPGSSGRQPEARPRLEGSQGHDAGSGLGLDAGDVDYFWQWGWLPGFRNLVVVDPRGRSAVIVMTNGSGGLQLAEEIVRLVLPGEHPVFASMIDYWE